MQYLYLIQASSSLFLKVFSVGAEITPSGSEFQAFVMRLVKNSALQDFCADSFFSFLLCPRVDEFESNGMKLVDTLYIPDMYLKHSIISPRAFL